MADEMVRLSYVGKDDTVAFTTIYRPVMGKVRQPDGSEVEDVVDSVMYPAPAKADGEYAREHAEAILATYPRYFERDERKRAQRAQEPAPGTTIRSQVEQAQQVQPQANEPNVPAGREGAQARKKEG